MLKSRIYAILIVTVLSACAVQCLAQTVAPKQDEPKLIAVLKSPDASQKDKVDACRQLAIIGGKDSIAPLAALLGDEKLSHMARYALEPNPDPAVNEALRDALGKLKGGPLVGVIGSIGVRRDAAAIPALIQRLNDSDAVVARAAARALGSIGTVQAAQALQKALPNTPADSRLDVCEGLFRCAERFAADRQNSEAIAIYDQLRKLDSPHQVRGGALKGAILARGAEGVTLLQENLRSSDYILFSAAVQAAQKMPGAEVTKALVGGMKNLPPDNLVVVIQTLAVRGDKGALPVLFAVAGSGPKPVRVAAIEAATAMGDASAVPVLMKLMDDSDAEIAGVAQEGLAALPGKEADAAVMAMFNSGNADKQLTAINLMGRRRMMSSTPALLKAAREGDPKVRPAAIKLAGDLAGPEQVPALLDLLGQVEKREDLDAVEQGLTTACTKADNPQPLIAAVINRLDQAKPLQKAALLRVLAAVGGADALKAVLAAINSGDPQVHTAAVRALGAWKTTDAAPHLLTFAKEAKDPSERTLFLRGYLNIAARADLPAEERLAMCGQAASMIQRDEEKRLLLGTLGSIDSPEAIMVILPYLDNAGTREEAAAAIVNVAEKLLRGPERDKYLESVSGPVEKAAAATTNNDTARRAEALLRRARTRG